MCSASGRVAGISSNEFGKVPALASMRDTRVGRYARGGSRGLEYLILASGPYGVNHGCGGGRRCWLFVDPCFLGDDGAFSSATVRVVGSTVHTPP